MRLGKEQAVGYVEDTEADSLSGLELSPAESQLEPTSAEQSPAAVPAPSLTAS
jgi:hypothetical protein